MIQVSVIIPTRNRCSLLGKTLKSISVQAFPQDRFEVIVVDNGSTDETSTVTSNAKGLIKNLKYFYEPKPGLHEGRHCGLRESAGTLLTFADDDIEAFPSWIEGIYESFQTSSVGIVGGKDLPLYEAAPPAWIDDLWDTSSFGKYMPYFSLLDFGDHTIEIDPDFVFGCNFSIRKNLLMQVQGFHPDGVPESQLKYRGDGETYVAREVSKLGYQVMYNPKASVNHWVPKSRMNLEYMKKRAFMSGVSQSFTDSRNALLSEKKLPAKRTYLDVLRKIRYHQFFSRSVKSKILGAYFHGYEFHQAELRKDKELVEWVTKPNYL